MITAIYKHPEFGYSKSLNLEVGREYEVTGIHMGPTHTEINLKGIEGDFESVKFEFYENGNPLNIYNDPRFNPWLRR